jgi:anti-sigma factor RsiW
MDEDDMTPPRPPRDIANIAGHAGIADIAGIAGMDRELVRLLAGELTPEREREVRARLEREPALAAAHQKLERAWHALEMGSPGPVPPGFGGRVMARVRAEGRPGLSWSGAPAWVRATAAAALVGGLALGAGLGGTALTAFGAARAPAETALASEPEAAEAAASSLTESSLAESYWSLVEDVGGGGESASDGQEEDL